jgi:hypothetical protein
MNQQQQPQTVWGDLSDSQRGIYLNFYARRVNNVPVEPSNNDAVWMIHTPTEAQINAVSDMGDELCRTINYRLTDGQYDAIQAWVREHGSNHQIARLTPRAGL